MADVSMGANQFTHAHVTGTDAAGHPGVFTVPPGWSSDGSLLKLTPSPDGLSCRIEASVPTSDTGTSVVTCTYAPTGGPTLTATLNVTLTHGPITTLEITADPPSDLPTREREEHH